MPDPERRVRDPRLRLEKRLSSLTSLVYPEDQSASHVLSLQISISGVSNSQQRRGSIKVIDEAISAIKGLGRFIDSGGIVEVSQVRWKRFLPSDDPKDCVEFTGILR